MDAEIKQILYKPAQYDQETGELKKDAFFTINLNVDISEETRDALLDIMAGGSPSCKLTLTPSQPTFAGIPSVTEATIGEV